MGKQHISDVQRRRSWMTTALATLAAAATMGAVLVAPPSAMTMAEAAEVAHSNVALSGYDKDQVLEIDGSPYFYNGIQLRADKLLTQIGYRQGVSLDANDPTNPASRSLEAIFKQVADAGFNTVNTQILWSDLQKNVETTKDQVRTATISADGSVDANSFQTVYEADNAKNQQLGAVTFDIPETVKNIDGSLMRLYVNNSSDKQQQFGETEGLYYSHGLKVYALPEAKDPSTLTWKTTGLGEDLAYDGENLTAGDKTVEPAFLLPKWDQVKRTYFYEFDVTDAVAAARKAGRKSITFLVGQAPAQMNSGKDGDADYDKAKALAEPVSFETAGSDRTDGTEGVSGRTSDQVTRALRPTLISSDASIENIDWTYYDTLIRYAAKYGLNFEVIWFGSDSTGLNSDFRVPGYVFHKYQMMTADRDETMINWNGSKGTPMFQKRVGDANYLYCFLGDRADEDLMKQEGAMLKAIGDHTAELTDENGKNIGGTLIGVQTQNEPYNNGWMNGSMKVSTGQAITPASNDGISSTTFSRSDDSIALLKKWQTTGDPDHGNHKVSNGSEFRAYELWYYNDYLGKQVKASKLPVWTRVNHQLNANPNLIDINEQMRKETGTNIDFVGLDTYGQSTGNMYNIGHGGFWFNVDKGDNVPVVMEDGMNNENIPEKIFATVAGGGVHNGYNACSHDGDALFDSWEENPTGACVSSDRPLDSKYSNGSNKMTYKEKIERVETVNRLLEKVSYDLATRNADVAGGNSLFFYNPTNSNGIGTSETKTVGGALVTYTVAKSGVNSNKSSGFAIARAGNELALGTTEETTFRIEGLKQSDVSSIELGSYDADASSNGINGVYTSNLRTDNTWTKDTTEGNDGNAVVAYDDEGATITVPKGAVARVLTKSALPEAGPEYKFEAESSKIESTDAIERYDDGASGGKWDKHMSNEVGDWISYKVNVPADGEYNLYTRYLKADGRGIVDVEVDGKKIATDDLYADTKGFVTAKEGTITLTAGDHVVKYVVSGKNEKSSGYVTGIDYILLRGKAYSCPTDEDVVLCETFSSQTDPENFGFAKYATVFGGRLNVSGMGNFTAAGTSLPDALKGKSEASASFLWSGVTSTNDNGNSKTGVQLKDSEGHLLFALTGAKGSEIRYSTSFKDGVDAVPDDTQAATGDNEPVWTTVNADPSQSWRVTVTADFKAKKVSYSVAPAAGGDPIIKGESDTSATSLSRLVLANYWGVKTSQWLDNVELRAEADKPSVDKTRLQAAVDEAGELVESDYTADSWSEFARALDMARTVLADDKATADDVAAALEQLTTAKDALVEADKPEPGTPASPMDRARLAARIQEIRDLNLAESDWTADSWKALRDALAAGEGLLGADGLTVERVDRAIESIDAAYKGLVKAEEPEPGTNTPPVLSGVGDATVMVGDAFDYYAGVAATDKEDGLLPVSQIEVEGRVDTSKPGRYELAYTATDYQGLKSERVTRWVTVVERTAQVDKAALQALVDAYRGLDGSGYTADSWARFKAAYADAESVLADGSVSQERVDQAARALRDAWIGLRFRPSEPSGPSYPSGPSVSYVTVRFDSRGGSAVADRVVVSGTTVEAPAAPVRDGYAFYQWTTDAAGLEPYDFGGPVTGSLTLYAQWKVPVYRLYNPYMAQGASHLYTVNRAEYDYLKTQGWNQEGVAFLTDSKDAEGVRPVYRLYNQYDGSHHFTLDPEEYAYLKTQGWTQEGVAWYASDTQGSDVYRLYNRYTGEHLWTTSQQEYDYLESQGWTQEGVAFKAYLA